MKRRFVKLTDNDVCAGRIPKSQVGEGFIEADEIKDQSLFYNKGGKIATAFKLYSNGIGPANENVEFDGKKIFEYKGLNG